MRQSSPIKGVPAIIRTAHGTAAAGGAVLVAEQPPLDEYPPLNAAHTVTGLALKAARGRPFQPGNAAAKNKGPSLTRFTIDPQAPESLRSIHRKAQSLAGQRRRELEVQCGGDVSSAVRVELVSWARAVAWAAYYDALGEPLQAIAFGEKASGHLLKATGQAEREAGVRRKDAPKVSPMERIKAKALAAKPKEPT